MDKLVRDADVNSMLREFYMHAGDGWRSKRSRRLLLGWGMSAAALVALLWLFWIN